MRRITLLSSAVSEANDALLLRASNAVAGNASLVLGEFFRSDPACCVRGRSINADFAGAMRSFVVDYL